MALAPWQVVMYLDEMDVYRQVIASDGNPMGYMLMSAGNLCHYHATQNYDAVQSPAGLSKVENIMTANMIECDVDCEVEGADIVKITTRLGVVSWEGVRGVPRIRSYLPRREFYGTPTQPPRVANSLMAVYGSFALTGQAVT